MIPLVQSPYWYAKPGVLMTNRLMPSQLQKKKNYLYFSCIGEKFNFKHSWEPSIFKKSEMNDQGFFQSGKYVH